MIIRQHATLDAATRQRGVEFLQAIYTPERYAVLFDNWGADMEWLTKDVVYGLFYGDEGTFDNRTTEVITFVGILSQGMPAPFTNHTAGLKRMGYMRTEVEGITHVAQLVIHRAEKQRAGDLPDVGKAIRWD